MSTNKQRPTKLDTKRQALAKALGVAAEDLRLETSNWQDFMKDGVIVSLHVGRFRGVTTLTNDDLGLPRETHGRLIELGNKKLLPPTIADKLQSLEVAARNYIRNRSITTGWGQFVPVTAFDGVMNELRKRRDEYMALGQTLVSTYDTWVPALLDEYRREAESAYRRARAFSRDGWSNLRYTPSEEEFVGYYLDTIRSRIPTRQAIAQSFMFDIELSYIPLPSILAKDYEKAQEIKVEGERARRLAAMNAAVVREAQEQKEKLVDDFLTAIVGELRQRTYDVMQQALVTVKKNGQLQARTVVALRNWIDTVRALNFYGDKEISDMIAPIQAQINGEGTRNLDDIVNTLREFSDVALDGMLALGVRPKNQTKDPLFVAAPIEVNNRKRLPAAATDPMELDDEGIRPVRRSAQNPNI